MDLVAYRTWLLSLRMLGSAVSEFGAYCIVGEERFSWFRMWHVLALEILQELLKPFRSSLVQSRDAMVVRHGFHFPLPCPTSVTPGACT